MNENDQISENKGLGDYVEDVIKIVLPKTHARKNNCTSCRRRKEWLNNAGAIF